MSKPARFKVGVVSVREGRTPRRSLSFWELRYTDPETGREVKRRAVERLPFDGAQLGRLVALIDSGTIHRAQAKVVLGEMFERGGDPDEIVRKRGLEQLADADALRPMIERVLAEHTEKVEQYRSGRTGLLGFFVGQVMKLSRGKANPKVVEEIVRHELETR